MDPPGASLVSYHTAKIFVEVIISKNLFATQDRFKVQTNLLHLSHVIMVMITGGPYNFFYFLFFLYFVNPSNY